MVAVYVGVCHYALQWVVLLFAIYLIVSLYLQRETSQRTWLRMRQLRPWGGILRIHPSLTEGRSVDVSHQSVTPGMNRVLGAEKSCTPLRQIWMNSRGTWMDQMCIFWCGFHDNYLFLLIIYCLRHFSSSFFFEMFLFCPISFCCIMILMG